ncbi:hypothetical protein Tco_0750011 [Tanacetum coccineum]|uniref:Uncharacterized protein n=1 Tax=Tanacetum coccineum TaxID=301880 RepID=A0ABQ4Z2W1_9ASTR
MVQMMISLTHMNAIKLFMLVQASFFTDVVGQQFKPRSSIERCLINQFKPHTMAEENIPAPEPTRRDEQILHCSEWLQIGKGNLLLDLQKLQKNPIFRISVDIRQNTNFVRAFTTSANVPSIYIQLFWNTLTHDAKTGVYSFQVDEHWLTLSAYLLRKALDVTPADSAHPLTRHSFGIGKSISLMKLKEEAGAREVHEARNMPRDSFGTGGSNEGPDVDSEHFDRDDNAGDDNEETGAGDDNADPA